MVTAEQWYEYQENYKKYGIDMRPAEPVRERAKKSEIFSAKDKLRLMLFAIVCGAVCVCVIISTAFAATLKYEANTMLAENAEIQREIETINVRIKTEANIKTIEEKAIGQLGMIYPDYSNTVYISEKYEGAKDFAMLLKEQAYN